MRPLFGPAMMMAALAAACACSSEEPELTKYKVTGSDAVILLPDSGPDVGAGDASASDQVSLISVIPNHGPFVGGASVLLRGTGFTSKCKVQIGGKNIQVGKTKLNNAQSLTVATPAGTPGAADVEVTCGTKKATLAKGYIYDPVYLDPNSGPTAGGTLVTVYGTGTNFKTGMKITLAGKALLDVKVAGGTTLTAKTPPNSSGLASLWVDDGKNKPLTINGAYQYYVSTNPKAGGLGGGPIKGTLTVSVLDSQTRAPIGGASVLVHDDKQTFFSGITNISGVKVFSKTGFKGPVHVTAGKDSYESTSVLDLDARDVTLMLVKISSPGSGPGPPSPIAGAVKGHLLFGGSTGVGTSAWKIIPEPATGEVKRAYIYTSISTIGAKLPDIATVQFVDFDPTAKKKTAWAYSMAAAPGMKAVYAVVGLFNKTTSKFIPHAMGVARGVVVGPGSTTDNVNILVEIPLGRSVTLQLKDVPTTSKIYKVRLGVDLGAEGFIVRSDMELSGATTPPATLSYTRLPNFNYTGLTDASWAVDAALDGSGTPTAQGLPYIRGTSRAMKAVNDTLVMDKFVGDPTLDSPVKAQYLTDDWLKWTPSGATADVVVIRILGNSFPPVPVWRIFARGTVKQMKLPDTKISGLNAWPTGMLLVWAQWMVKLHDGYKFDEFNYNHLYTKYWSRWSQQQSYFQLKTTTP